MAHVANVTVDNTKVTADLTDFPVYIDLSDLPSTFWNTVANGGGDIRCYKSDGTTQLPREVVSCDTSTDTGELFVKYSGTLSSSVDTVIQIHADGTSSEPAASSTYGSENTWRTVYKAVYHCDTDMSDSTANGNDMTENNSPTHVAAKVGDGIDLERGSSQDASIADASQTGLDITGDRAIGAWVNYETLATSILPIVSKWDAAGGQRSYYFATWDDSGTKKLLLGNSVNGSTTSNATVNWAPSTSTFYRVWAVYDASAGETDFYVNGSQQGATQTGLINSVYSGSADVHIGGVDDGGGFEFFDGIIDEVYIVEAELASTWISTEYNNQNSPSTFYSTEAVESAFTPIVMMF